MPKARVLNIADELCRLPVLDSESAQLYGRVVEAVIHPTKGMLLGLLLQSPGGAERAIAGDDCHIFSEAGAVLVSRQSVTDRQRLAHKLADGIAVCRDLLGANVVKEDGEPLGRVTDAFLHEEYHQIFYRISNPRLQEFWGGCFYIEGHVPLTWSSPDARLIVPEHTASIHATSSPQTGFTVKPSGVRKELIDGQAIDFT